MTEPNTESVVHEDPLTDHEYDGIQEYDNPMPRWWVWIYWGTFYFAACYFLWNHVYMKGTSVVEEYAEDMRQAREAMAAREMGTEVTEASLARLASNAGIMSDARGIWKARCVQCHNQNGEGLIGPNLTDGFWIHGQATLMDIYQVVSGGVAAKGMPAWGKQLSKIEVSKVVAYVGTLRNTNLPGKPPEGAQVAPTAPGPKGG